MNSFEYNLVQKEYLRCLKLINVYKANKQFCILFKLRSFECLINKVLYDKVINGVMIQLQNDNYDVFKDKSQLLILWDHTNKRKDKPPEIKPQPKIQSNKKGKKDDNIILDHIDLHFGDFVDNFPIKTGNY